MGSLSAPFLVQDDTSDVVEANRFKAGGRMRPQTSTKAASGVSFTG